MAHCRVCHAPLAAPRYRYCSTACAADGRRSRRRKRPTRGRCAHCRRSFRRSRRSNRYCRSACRKAAWRRAHAHEDPLTLLRQDVRAMGLQLRPPPTAVPSRCRCGGPVMLITENHPHDLLTAKGCRRCLTPDVLRCRHAHAEPPRRAGYRACVACGAQILTVRRTGSVLSLRNR